MANASSFRFYPSNKLGIGTRDRVWRCPDQLRHLPAGPLANNKGTKAMEFVTNHNLYLTTVMVARLSRG